MKSKIKKQIKKISLGSSIGILALCVVLITGSTFSLFTSEDSNSITVTSANVKIEASLAELQVKSIGMPFDDPNPVDGSFGNKGTTAKLNGGSLVVNNMAPGDAAKVTVMITNTSSIAISYRIGVKMTVTKVADEDTLVDSSEFVVSAIQRGDENTEARELALTGAYTGWSKPVVGNVINPVDVTIELPVEASNDAQGLKVQIDFTVEAVQSNAANIEEIKTEEELYSALVVNGYAKLANDIVLTKPIVIPAKVGNRDVEAELDLNGYTVSIAEGNAIVSNGSLVIVDTAAGSDENAGEDETGSVESGVMAVAALLEGETPVAGITTGSGYAIKNNGKLTVSAGKITGVENTGALEIAGGDFENADENSYTISNTGAAATVIIVGGEFTTESETKSIVYSEGQKVEIKGGSFTVDEEENTVVSGQNITVTAGAFDGKIANAGDENNKNVVIESVTSSTDEIPYEYLPNGTTTGTDEEGNIIVIQGKKGTGAEDDPFIIDRVYDLEKLAEEVNAGNSYQGKYFLLVADIDLAGKTWIPIGNSTTSFNGHFDGGDHTISNLTAGAAGQSNIGFFGYTQNGSVKNINFKNATVTGRLNVGVVAGQPYTTTYEDITISGHVEVNGLAYVGGALGKNVYANVDNITIAVDETSYVNGYSIENGSAYRTYVGGVIGFMGEGAHTVSNITSNINVIGSTIDVGGIVGIAHYGNRFENITCTGNVTVTDASEAGDAEEIGGIAGVWHNETGYTVTFIDCVFSGNLSANITEGVDLSDNTITGAAYSATGTGTLVIKNYIDIDGVTYCKDAVNNVLTLYLVPEEYTGDTVTVVEGTYAIGNYAFAYNKNVKTVILASTVRDLGRGFDSAPSVEKVVLNEGLTTISSRAFRSTYALKEVVFSSTVTVIEDNAFQKSAIKEIVIPASVTTIGETAFGASLIEKVTFEGNTDIQGYAFRGCTKLNTVVLNGLDVNFVKSTLNGRNSCWFCNGESNNPNTSNITFYVKTNVIKDRVLTAMGAEKNNTPVVVEMSTVNGYEVDDNDVAYVYTGEALRAAIKDNRYVVMACDITVAAAKGGYSVAGIVLNNAAQIVDGNGHVLTVTGANDSYGSGIYMTGGTVKNLVVKGAFRGIFTAGSSADIYLENISFDGVVYTYNSDDGNKSYGVYATNCTFNGWTSYSNVHKEVVFTNCTFTEGNGYAFCRPYNATKFVDCTFTEGYAFDTSKVYGLVFENCYYGKTLITVANALSLKTGEDELFYNGLNGAVINGAAPVEGGYYVDAEGKAYVFSADALNAAVNNGATEIVIVASLRLPSNTTSATVKFVGVEGVVVDVTWGAYWDNATLTFENVSFKTSTGYVTTNGTKYGSDYAALYSKNITYTNCNFSGAMRLGRDGASFNGCTFNDLGNDYIWTYGKSVSFDSCTFNTNGKAILIYSDGGNAQSAVSITNCTFNATAAAYAGAISNMSCAAIEIHNYGCGVALTTSGNTFDTEFSGEWRIKTYEAGRSAIAVNGVTYTQTALDGELFTIVNKEATFN